MGTLPSTTEEKERGREPHCGRIVRRLDHGCAILEALRHQGEAFRPSRYFCLGAAQTPWPAPSRRRPGPPRFVPLFRQRARTVTGTTLDSRRHAFRGDLAASSLKDRVHAPRYVEGERLKVVQAALPLRKEPRFDALLESEALLGELVIVFDESEG